MLPEGRPGVGILAWFRVCKWVFGSGLGWESYQSMDWMEGCAAGVTPNVQRKLPVDCCIFGAEMGAKRW